MCHQTNTVECGPWETLDGEDAGSSLSSCSTVLCDWKFNNELLEGQGGVPAMRCYVSGLKHSL